MRQLIAAVLLSALAASPALAEGKTRVLTQLFVSPSGEPFRATADEPYPIADWFAQADTNHDGALSYLEFKADAMRFFDKIDRNHDGVIDPDETVYYENNIVPEIVAVAEGIDEPRVVATPSESSSGGPDGTTVAGGSSPTDPKIPKTTLSSTRGAAAFGIINEPEPIAGGDEDFNQRISRDEWAHATRARFDILDPKETGKLTLAQLPEPPIMRFLRKKH